MANTTTSTPATSKPAPKGKGKGKGKPAPRHAPQLPALPMPAPTPPAPGAAPAPLGTAALRVLALLAQAGPGVPVTRKALAARTGVAKGWARLMGAALRAGGVAGAKGLCARGYCTAHNAGGLLAYAITPAGLAAHKAATAAPAQ